MRDTPVAIVSLNRKPSFFGRPQNVSERHRMIATAKATVVTVVDQRVG